MGSLKHRCAVVVIERHDELLKVLIHQIFVFSNTSIEPMQPAHMLHDEQFKHGQNIFYPKLEHLY